MIKNKKFTITLCLSAMVILAVTTSMQQETKKPDYKNLKVLPKNISEQDLDKVMHEWEGALGVRCSFCHARNAETNKTDWASDAKPEKGAARKMMTMTAKINKKFFKGDKDEQGAMIAAVNCNTCHHGSPHPEAKAAGMERPNRGQQGAGGQQRPGGQQQGPPPGGTTTPPPPGR